MIYNLAEVIALQVDRTIRALIDHSGMSTRAMSAALDRGSSWASTTAAPGRDPKLSTVADVADVAGVDIALIDRKTGEMIGTVTPPRRAAGDD